MDVTINSHWKAHLIDEFSKPYFSNLVAFIDEETKEHSIFPPQSLIFNAFNHCSFEQVKVVIIGQDPYHGDNQANGLCFSVNDNVRLPPSLRNIYKELKTDVQAELPISGNLERWAKQGILMLNATLTVRSSVAGSHQKQGWEEFTDAVIQLISDKKEQIVFLLWGAYAQKKGMIIDENKHYIIKSPHPSPFSAHKGFFDSKPFSKTNSFLKKIGLSEIYW
jgi:uracil-DNA glycosylase